MIVVILELLQMIWTYIRVEYKLIYRHYATTFSVASLCASGSGLRWLGNRSCSWTTCRLSRCFEGSKACCHWLSRADSNALWVFSRILLDRHESHPDVCFGVDHLISECCETNRWKAFESVVWELCLIMFPRNDQAIGICFCEVICMIQPALLKSCLSVFAGKTPHWFSVGTGPGLV